MNRREFFRVAAGSSALLALSRRAWATCGTSPALAKFVDDLPGLTPAGKNQLGQYIPVATATPGRLYGQDVDVYDIAMVGHCEQMHRSLPPTPLWGYVDAAAASDPHYLGPAIVAKAGRPAVVRYTNALPQTHPLGDVIDTTLMGADGAPNRVSPHLHGGFVTWESDGGPFAWFGADASHGPAFTGRDFWYSNQQSARLMWYHDHALGITRLNAYAGLAAPYVLRDDFEQSLIAQNLIPGHEFEIPLVIQDKSFCADGRLAYSSVYDADYGPEADPPAKNVHTPLPSPSCVPEFFGDTTVVNGTCFPKLTLRPGIYRFRILNAAQARFYNLNLFYASFNGKTADVTRSGPGFVQIAAEGGFLPAPVAFGQALMAFDPKTGNATRYNLLLGPAERADILLDLRNVATGSQLILYNDAPAPFPGGDPGNDIENDDAGPDTRNLLRIDIAGSPTGQAPINFGRLTGALASRLKGDLSFGRRDVVRRLTLNEDFDDYGRLIQRLGTDVSLGPNSQGLVTYGRGYCDTPTETPRAGDVETWEIYNLTGDTHPVHFHLVNVHVLNRRRFDPSTFGQKVPLTGPTRPPDANERGWKETVRMNPFEVTTVEMRFDLPVVPYDVPFSPRLRNDYSINGYEYVWHCHILEHEEHDMMRPVAVLPR